MILFSRIPPIVVLLAVVSGCSTDTVANVVATKNDSNIKRVVNLYNAYQLMHGWQGPKDEKALRDFIADGEIPEKNLAMMGIDPKNLDNVFKSERDGKPFKIRYGAASGRFVTDALVFDDGGENGKKLVAFNGPVVEEVTEARFKELWEHGGPPTGTRSGGGPDVPPPSANN
jgi:hypothetical protein